MARIHAECRRMIEAFRATGLPLFVAYYRRALPRFVQAKELIDGGALGRVTGCRYRHDAPVPPDAPDAVAARPRALRRRAASSTSAATRSTCSITCSARSSESGGMRSTSGRRRRSKTSSR